MIPVKLQFLAIDTQMPYAKYPWIDQSEDDSGSAPISAVFQLSGVNEDNRVTALFFACDDLLPTTVSRETLISQIARVSREVDWNEATCGKYAWFWIGWSL